MQLRNCENFYYVNLVFCSFDLYLSTLFVVKSFWHVFWKKLGFLFQIIHGVVLFIHGNSLQFYSRIYNFPKSEKIFLIIIYAKSFNKNAVSRHGTFQRKHWNRTEFSFFGTDFYHSWDWYKYTLKFLDVVILREGMVNKSTRMKLTHTY